MKQIFEILQREGVPYFLSSFSALDKYLHADGNPYAYIFTEATLAELAGIVPGLEFPGLDSVDAAIFGESETVFFTTSDSESAFPRSSFNVQSLLFEPGRSVYRDPYSVYHDLRRQELVPEQTFTRSWRSVHDAAILVSRYHYTRPDFSLGPEYFGGQAEEEDQRTLLTSIMTGKRPWKGLSLLMEEGYLQEHWPELFRLDGVSHSKEYHPEGNVWQHTLETFKYRKTQDLVLSLGLFLHDIGKPAARKFEGKPFDGHAEIGADIARGFLRRLGYPESIVEQVFFLIKYHMIPGALTKLPVSRVEHLMASPLFPVLLELYRCDLSSTYRGPGGYYEACNVYKTFLRNTRNPFRSPDGKKLVRLYVE